MTGYLAFLKKEFLESVRSYRLMIQLLLLLTLGIISPLTAKLLPDLLTAMDLQGMVITLPEPAAIDSYAQFFGNLVQMGLIALAIINSSLLAGDISKGTLTLLLTKGLGKSAAILAKLTVAITLWSAGLLLSFSVTYGYTAYLFGHDQIFHLGLSLFCLWIFGCFLLCLLFLAAALTGKTSGTMLATGGIICLLFILNLFPAVSAKSPLLLASANLAMLDASFDLNTIYPALWITCALTAGLVALTLIIFHQRKYDS